jgi:hypothetical protein
MDEKVFKMMRREQVGVVGIALLILGYFLEIPSKV